MPFNKTNKKYEKLFTDLDKVQHSINNKEKNIYMKFILIVATGRSGSTTLQRIINTIPDSNITGEKWGSIINLVKSYNSLKTTNIYSPIFGKNNKISYEEIIHRKIKPAFYNSYNFEEVTNNIKKTILSILKKTNEDNSVLGYKEIRWNEEENLYLLNDFLELFPNTKIILHIHDNIKEQALSGWWANRNGSEEKLNKETEEIKKYYLENKKNCYLSYKKDIFDIEKIKDIFVFLDEPFDEEKYINIINNNLK